MLITRAGEVALNPKPETLNPKPETQKILNPKIPNANATQAASKVSPRRRASPALSEGSTLNSTMCLETLGLRGLGVGLGG